MAEFTLDLSSVADELASDIQDTVIRRFGLGVLTRVIRKTPVDTGRMRANWQVSFDNPETQSLDRTDRVGSMTLARGSSRLQSFDLRRNTNIYLSNNLSYAPSIESGSSQQAPSGVAGISLREEAELFNSYRST